MTKKEKSTVERANAAAKAAIRARLEELGIVLPPAKEPVGNYMPTIACGNLLYVSGHGPWVGGHPIVGKVGATMSLEEGKEAAYHVALGILSTVEMTVGLERVYRLVESLGLVNSAPTFTQHPEVIDGYSDVMASVFGPVKGVGARTAIGVASLPFGIAAEVKCIFELKDI